MGYLLAALAGLAAARPAPATGVNCLVTNRRTILKRLIGVVALLGIVAVAYPFISSMKPSAKVRAAARMEVDVTDIEPGTYAIVDTWRGPLVFFRPSPETVRDLIALNGRVNGATLANESIPPAFVYSPFSTYKNCALEHAGSGQLGDEWLGGWYDPCHMGAWDYAGRTVLGAMVPKGKKLPPLSNPFELQWEGEIAKIFEQ